uniref:Uncharacterized protein n=1 Tax=Solanum lycopersicum TaxID=4081 RepID=A0A3Q7G493_SOLLC
MPIECSPITVSLTITIVHELFFLIFLLLVHHNRAFQCFYRAFLLNSRNGINP